MGLKDLVDNLWFNWFTPVGHRKVKCSGLPGQFYYYEAPFPGGPGYPQKIAADLLPVRRVVECYPDVPAFFNFGGNLHGAGIARRQDPGQNVSPQPGEDLAGHLQCPAASGVQESIRGA